jgi:hypothetical protein
MVEDLIFTIVDRDSASCRLAETAMRLVERFLTAPGDADRRFGTGAGVEADTNRCGGARQFGCLR